MTVTLEQYEQAEREVSMHEARIALRVHAIVTVAVVAALAMVKIVIANNFPWSVFVAVGMSLWSRPAARSRSFGRAVSVGRSPHPACPSQGTGRSTSPVSGLAGCSHPMIGHGVGITVPR